MARRLVRAISLLVVAGMAASIIAACGGEFDFQPGGLGGARSGAEDDGGRARDAQPGAKRG